MSALTAAPGQSLTGLPSPPSGRHQLGDAGTDEDRSEKSVRVSEACNPCGVQKGRTTVLQPTRPEPNHSSMLLTHMGSYRHHLAQQFHIAPHSELLCSIQAVRMSTAEIIYSPVGHGLTFSSSPAVKGGEDRTERIQSTPSFPVNSELCARSVISNAMLGTAAGCRGLWDSNGAHIILLTVTKQLGYAD
ncbi:hypothetical protein AOLI_G00091360 [Acnodon oligacanthus]